MSLRACVTGGAGFIGSHLVDRLVRLDARVTVLDDLSSGRLANLSDSLHRLRFVHGDVRDAEAVRSAVQDADVVFHQAARASVVRSIEDPEGITSVNVGGTVQILAAAQRAGVKRVVFASSSSVYGDVDLPVKREDLPLNPRSPYAASKAAGEQYLAAFEAAYGMECVALRYFNVYGPRQSADSAYAAVVPLFVQAYLDGHAPTVFGDGLQTRDFTFVADVVEANVRAGTLPGVSGRVMNVGAGEAHSIMSLATKIGAIVGTSLEARFEPPRAGDVKHSLADLERLETTLGWRPATPLDVGLRRVVEAHIAERASAEARAARTRAKEQVA